MRITLPNYVVVDGPSTKECEPEANEWVAEFILGVPADAMACNCGRCLLDRVVPGGNYNAESN